MTSRPTRAQTSAENVALMTESVVHSVEYGVDCGECPTSEVPSLFPVETCQQPVLKVLLLGFPPW
jgi:hypothetical protein